MRKSVVVIDRYNHDSRIEYKSTYVAANDLCINPGTISYYCGNRNPGKRYSFCYKDDEDDISNEDIIKKMFMMIEAIKRTTYHHINVC